MDKKEEDRKAAAAAEAASVAASAATSDADDDAMDLDEDFGIGPTPSSYPGESSGLLPPFSPKAGKIASKGLTHDSTAEKLVEDASTGTKKGEVVGAIPTTPTKSKRPADEDLDDTPTKKTKTPTGAAPAGGVPADTAETTSDEELAEGLDDDELAKILGKAGVKSPERPIKIPKSILSKNWRETMKPPSVSSPVSADEGDSHAADFEPGVKVQNEVSKIIHLYPGLNTQLINSENQLEAEPKLTVLSQRRELHQADEEDPFRNNLIGNWAEYRRVGSMPFVPGTVIKATYNVSQTDLKLEFPSADVRVYEHGPIHSKQRPMVILWKTTEGMMCAPMFSGEWLRKLPETHIRLSEFATVVTDKTKMPADWKGWTPLNGKPLHMDKRGYMKDESLVDLVRLVHVKRCDPMLYNQGQLSKESYVRLMDLLEYGQNIAKAQAFKELGLTHLPKEPAPKPLNWLWAHSGTPLKEAQERMRKIGLSIKEILGVWRTRA